MSIYVIGAIDIEDPEVYRIYKEKGFSSLQSGSAEIIAVDDDPVLIEGVSPARRIIVLRFNSREDFSRWYDSDSYREALPFRLQSSKTAFLLSVNGLEQ